MGKAMVARLGLGLLLLALLLPTQIYSNQTTPVTPTTNSSSSSQYTSAATGTPIATTSTTTSATTSKGNGGPLQCTASLLVVSISLLHLYC
ncbi:signal transducer CD24 [Dugong dugon]